MIDQVVERALDTRSPSRVAAHSESDIQALRTQDLRTRWIDDVRCDLTEHVYLTRCWIDLRVCVCWTGRRKPDRRQD